MTKIQKWPKCKKWWNGLSAEGAKANVRSALHSADDPPFFVFLSFSCIYFCCGSICSMGSMWAQQSYSAMLHLHLWWYYFHNLSQQENKLVLGINFNFAFTILLFQFCRKCSMHEIGRKYQSRVNNENRCSQKVFWVDLSIVGNKGFTRHLWSSAFRGLYGSFFAIA